jgi:hypothetical protein
VYHTNEVEDDVPICNWSDAKATERRAKREAAIEKALAKIILFEFSFIFGFDELSCLAIDC